MNEQLQSLWNLATLWNRDWPEVGATECDVIHREHHVTLKRYRPMQSDDGPESTYKTPLLLVPSLINRHYVLDLLPEKSFAEWFVRQGHDVYILDWGRPEDEARYITFDDLISTYIDRAVTRVARRSPRNEVHALGYCLGGTLTSIYNAYDDSKLAGHIAMAAPVQFDDDGLLVRWTNTDTFDVDALVEATGLVPWPLMQAAFHMLDPTLNLKKAVRLIDRGWEDEFLDSFLAIETWGNDNVSFPGEAFRKYINALYCHDELIRGELRIDGTRIDLSTIETPTLAVTFEHDHIVPAESARPLVDAIHADDAEHMHLPGGHVGAVVSRKSKQHLWPRLQTWLAERDGEPAETDANDSQSTDERLEEVG
jgi:polyhydroxyalkanoate synthase